MSRINYLKLILGASIIKRIKLILEYFPRRYSQVVFSQEGEDLLVNRYLKNKADGFFVDIGAHHPTRYSNTYFFYKKGWSGINIDAMPGSMKLFNRMRPRDINIEAAVGSDVGFIEYFMFDNPALNTFSSSLAKEYSQNLNFKFIAKRSIKIEKLETLLDRFCKSASIDFFTIDVEGFELEVLRSNNWTKYRPNIILVEILNFDLSNSRDQELVKYLNSINYILVAKTFNTCMFKTVSNV